MSERYGLTRNIFEVINAHLAEQGLMLRKVIVDATLIAAPPSTKNRDGNAREPEMHQTKKENQYYFGLKTHVGRDAHKGSFTR
ncbi:hypothetical protein HC341_04120 [Aquisalimonas sp. 2447]|uniref:hypothetical protein n=1 Tax=Aquisalimonas sp. 2447 TaxID=2740807 RepID=UPI00143275D5|nr:hypothetical protein [Aquisalimonas sp. 2447]QIT54472.1 hypothetical protein HC341_04120 [Aquisalimonas sp. 2447]